MLEILLIVHLVIAILLITIILVQRTSADGVSGIGSGNNLGVISGKSASNFLLKTTIVLATAFITNSLVLANLSTKKSNSINKKIESIEGEQREKDSLPIAK